MKGNTKFKSRYVLWRLLALLCVVLMLAGCVKAPTAREMSIQRENNAKKDLDYLKPPPNINFEQPLSLEQCIQIGLVNNLDLRIADLDREIANRETLAEKLRMLPSLRADGSYTQRDKLRKSDVYNWKDDKDERDYTVGELKDSGKANLTLTWNILDTMLAYVKSGQYEMREIIKEKQRHRQAQQLALDITDSYWQAAALEDALDYVHVVEERLKKVKDNINDAVSAGQLDRMDATESELRLKELELTIRQLQANLSSSRLKLSRLMGFNQNVQFTLSRPPIKPIVAALPHTKDLDIDSLEEYALTSRPELFEGDVQVLIQKEDAKYAMLSMFPGLSLFGGLHYDDNRLLHSNTWNSVGAALGWELLEIPSRYASYQGRQKAVQMAERQRLMTTAGVITQVHIALLDYSIKLDRFRLLEDTFMLARSLLDMANTKHQAGRLPALSVTQRQLEEMASKLRRDEAVVELLVAHKRLCVSIGLDPLDCDASLLQYAARKGAGTFGQKTALAHEIEREIEDVDLKPTYSTASSSGSSSSPLSSSTIEGKMWKCNVCGYIHKGDTPPDICPECGAPSSEFSPWSPSTVRALSQSPMSDAADNYLWKVQIGSFTQPGAADRRLDQIKDIDLRLADKRDGKITTFPNRGKLYNRVRLMGLTQAEARMMAQDLKNNGIDYWIIAPHSSHY